MDITTQEGNTMTGTEITKAAIIRATAIVSDQKHRGGKLAFGPGLTGGEWYSEGSWPSAAIIVDLSSFKKNRTLGARGLVLDAIEQAAEAADLATTDRA